VEDRPLAGQGQAQGNRFSARRRDERPYLLQGPLVWLRRRPVGQDPSGLLNGLPIASSTPELHLHLQEGENFALIDKLRSDATFPTSEKINGIDGLRVEYADGFGLARSSNTTPVVVLRFEGENPEALARIQAEFKSVILAAKPDAELPF